jgi:hypothetical protein
MPDLVKTIRFIKRRPDLTPEQFKWHWLIRHGPVLKQVVEMSAARKIVASFVADKQIAAFSPGYHLAAAPAPFDAMETIYFTHVREARQFFRTGLAEVVHEAERAFCDLETEPVIRTITLEDVMAERQGSDKIHRRTGQLKTVRTVNRIKELDLFQFRDHWTNHHKILETRSVRVGACFKFVVNFAIGEIITGTLLEDMQVVQGEPEFDVVMENYYETEEDVATFFNSGHKPAVRRDELNFIDLERPIFRTVMEEYTVAEENGD